MAYNLKAALSRLSAEKCNFQFLRGDDADQILISPTEITPGQIKQIEEECGSTKPMMKGVCFLDGKTIVFATKNAAAPAWEKMISTLLRDRKCEQFLPIALRQVDESGGGGSQGPATKAAGAKEEWEALKSSLIPQLRAALADPKTKDAVTKIISAAILKERAEAYADAVAIFQKLSRVVTLSPVASATPVSPAASPSPTAASAPATPEVVAPASVPATPASAAAAPPPVAPAVTPVSASPAASARPEVRPPASRNLMQSMNRLAPSLKQAVAKAPAKRVELLRPVAAFLRQMEAEDLEAARESLREAARALQATEAA